MKYNSRTCLIKFRINNIIYINVRGYVRQDKGAINKKNVQYMVWYPLSSRKYSVVLSLGKCENNNYIWPSDLYD